MNPSEAQDAWARRWGWTLITLAVLIAYWPLSTFHYTVTHGDTLNCWLPWRAFISSCLQDGHFPLWNPHQQFGYPMHADLQGPSWYVEAIALGGTVGHSIWTLQLLFLAYCIIGGIGCMRLIRTIHSDARTGVIAGLAYALGGFFTGHQMHFYAVISAAWLPWLFDAALRLMRDPGWRNAAYLAIIQGLLLTGGNHTFTIIAGYVLAVFFVAHGTEHWRSNRWIAMKPLFLWSSAAVVGAALIGGGVLHAWWETGPYLARAGGLAYEAAAKEALTQRSLWSLLFPFANGADGTWLGVDPPMSNVYMGALIFPLSVLALFRVRTMVENLFLVTGTVCAIVAFGASTPVHHWLWQYVPGMDLFRFPAYFRWFAWIAVVVLATGTLSALWRGNVSARSVALAWATASVVGIIAIVVTMSDQGADPEAISLFERMRAMGLGSRVLLSASLAIPALLIATGLAWRKRIGFTAVLVLVIVEMGWNTSFAQWNTALADIEPAWLHHRLSSLSEGPVIPEALPTTTYDDSGQRLHYLTHNTRDFLGGFSRMGVNTFWLKNAMALELEHSALWNAMARQPVVYQAESIVAWSAYVPGSIVAERDSGLVVLAEGVNGSMALPTSPMDAVHLTAFEPDAFTVKSNTRNTSLLVLKQSHYPGWEVRVDSEERTLLNVNVAAMAVEVPAGEHTVEFRYRKPIVPWLLAISLVTFFSLLSLLAFTSSGLWLAKPAIVLLAGMVGWSLFAHTPKRERLEPSVEQLVADIPDDAAVVVNDDGSLRNPFHGDMNSWSLRADKPAAAGRALDLLKAAHVFRTEELGHGELRPLYWVDAALTADPSVRAAIMDHYDVIDVDRTNGVTLVHLGALAEERTWRAVHLDTASRWQWLDQGSPYGSGCSFELDALRQERKGTLVFDMECAADEPAHAVLVVERKLGERTTDYRALPIDLPAPAGATITAYCTLPLDEMWRAGESLKVYTWSPQGDSLAMRHFRVRVAPERFDKW